MNLRVSIAFPLVLACCALALTLGSPGASPEVPREPREARSADVGDRCLDCHTALVRSYRRTGMANALGPIAPGELVGLGEVPDGTTGFRYRFEQDGQAARIVESWSPASGIAPTVTRKMDLGFAVGAGRIDRSYAAIGGSLMWFAPLEVKQHAKKPVAALAPGHAIRPGTRFTTPITAECLACHTDALPARDYPLNLRPARSAWKPAGIGCSACHAETDAHVRWRERDLAGEWPPGADPVRTFGGAGAIESVSACARCHLQGDASLLLEPGARGLAAGGGDLLDRRAVFVAAQPTHEVGFVSHVERMVLSPCFTQSLDERRALSCVTCHDPHRSVFEPEERALVRARCLVCHPAGGTTAEARGAGPCALPVDARAGQDCAQCHMRATGVFDVADVVIHDHWIRAQPGPPSPAGALRIHEALDAELAVFGWPRRPKPPYADDPGLWMMAYASYGRPDLALAHAQKPAGEWSRRLPTYHHQRGSLLERTTRPAGALSAYERALALDPEQAETSVNLGALLGRLKKPTEGLALLDALIEKHPFAEGALRNRALLAQQLGDLERFARDLEAAHKILPQAPLARALGQYWLQRGRSDLADAWMREAKKLDPTLP